MPKILLDSTTYGPFTLFWMTRLPLPFLPHPTSPFPLTLPQSFQNPSFVLTYQWYSISRLPFILSSPRKRRLCVSISARLTSSPSSGLHLQWSLRRPPYMIQNQPDQTYMPSTPHGSYHTIFSSVAIIITHTTYLLVCLFTFAQPSLHSASVRTGALALWSILSPSSKKNA